MKKYLVEFAFAENFVSVNEWQTMDGLEDALFRVFNLTENDFKENEKSGAPEYFSF